ncbi:MAG TPA: HEAT repeat domain-containing protein [Kofleriaceae bacterium]
MPRVVVLVLMFLTSLAVAQTPAKRPIADVIAELSDKSPDVRSKAAYALGKYTDDPARLTPLEKAATSDPVATVRANAMSSLSPRDVDAKEARWRKLYFTVLTGDADENVRKIGAMFLTPADPAHVNVLVGIHDKEKSHRVRNQIITALVDGKVPKLVDILIKIVENHPQPGRAIDALAFSGDPRAIPVLKAAAKRGATGSTGGALGALAHIKDPAVDDILLEFLGGTKDDQWSAITAITNSNRKADPRQTPLLIKIWQGEDKATRKRSISKLKAFDNGEDADSIHDITRILRDIAEADQAPCAAQLLAKGELKTYLKKILADGCKKRE